MAPTVGWLWYRWTLGIWYNAHGLLIPFIVAYLVYQDLRDDPDSGVRASPWGFLFLVPSLLLLALDSAIGTQLLSAVALVTCLPGLSLLLLGTERTKRLIFPLIIAALMLPIPAGFIAPLHLTLREISAWGTWNVVPLFGIPIMLEGTVLHLPRNTLLVADACSGFSTLYAAVTTALILAHWSQSKAKKFVVIVSAIILSAICNIARVTTMALLIHYKGAELLKTPLHEISGVAAFIVTLALLFAIGGPGVLWRRAP
jgi:exosortase